MKPALPVTSQRRGRRSQPRDEIRRQAVTVAKRWTPCACRACSVGRAFDVGVDAAGASLESSCSVGQSTRRDAKRQRRSLRPRGSAAQSTSVTPYSTAPPWPRPLDHGRARQAVALKLANDVDDLRVAQVGAVLLECQAETMAWPPLTC